MSEWDWLVDVGLGVLDYQSSSNAMDDSRDSLEEGFTRQNPWAAYQPAAGAGLMNLLANPGNIVDTPGYQFSYDQGLQSLFAKQAASGNRFSGRALEESMQFGQGLASQIYNQEMNRYAGLAGANFPNSGGMALGQGQSQLNQQDSFNQGYFWNNLFNKIPRGGGGSTAPSGGGGGNWLDPYSEDAVN